MTYDWKRAIEMTSKPDWAEDGEAVVDEATWMRAWCFANRMVHLGSEAPAPAPCPDGSVHLTWRRPGDRLVIVHQPNGETHYTLLQGGILAGARSFGDEHCEQLVRSFLRSDG